MKRVSLELAVGADGLVAARLQTTLSSSRELYQREIRVVISGVPDTRLQAGVLALRRGPAPRAQCVAATVALHPLDSRRRTALDVANAASRLLFGGDEAVCSGASHMVLAAGPFGGRSILAPRTVIACADRPDDGHVAEAVRELHVEIGLRQLAQLRAAACELKIGSLFDALRPDVRISESLKATVLGVSRPTLHRTYCAPGLNGNVLALLEVFLRRFGGGAEGLAALAVKVREAALSGKAAKGDTEERGVKRERERFNDAAETLLLTLQPLWLAAGSKGARAPIEQRALEALSANVERYGEHTLAGVSGKMANSHKRANAAAKKAKAA